MTISALSQSVEQEQTYEAEACRLANELRSKPARTVINTYGSRTVRTDIPAKQGFDIETASFKTMVNYLADSRIKKSESIIQFIHKVLHWRFEAEYNAKKDKIFNRFKLEKEMIQSNAKRDIEWLGESGFQNFRQDGLFHKSNVITEKLRDGTVKSKRK
jgi:hypothetical protein